MFEPQEGSMIHNMNKRVMEVGMREAWERLIVGPPDAARSVLLLPGGACSARSFDLVMAEPVLSGVRLVATTLPGNAGAPVAEEVSIPAVARRAGELAKDNACEVVVGFSYGATVRWTWCWQDISRALSCCSVSA
jgi:pimeloyl-ACP methyl ester carboxylesterase